MTTADLRLLSTDYVAQAREVLAQAREYLAAGRLHQGLREAVGTLRRTWLRPSPTAQGWEYDAHDGFSVVLNRACHVTGDDRIRSLRGIANDLHGNYYRRKRHLNAELIGQDIESVARLLGILAPLTVPSR